MIELLPYLFLLASVMPSAGGHIEILVSATTLENCDRVRERIERESTRFVMSLGKCGTHVVFTDMQHGFRVGFWDLEYGGPVQALAGTSTPEGCEFLRRVAQQLDRGQDNLSIDVCKKLVE